MKVAQIFFLYLLAGYSLFVAGCNSNTPSHDPIDQAAKRSLIIDTDCGPDDMMAIAYLLSAEGVEIEAITTSYGLADVRKGAENMRQVLALAGREDIPVYIGQAKPLSPERKYPASWIELSEDFSSYDLPSAQYPPESLPAHAYMAQRLAKGPVEILTLGALTNIARVVQASPEAVSHITNLVIMGGAVEVEGNVFSTEGFVSPTDSAEWNLFVDPEAAAIVFAAPIPIQLVPLDATNFVPIDGAFLDHFGSQELSPLGHFVDALLESIREHAEADHYFAWDPLAALVWHQPDFTENAPYPLVVHAGGTDAGQSYISVEKGREMMVSIKASQAGFNTKFLEAFTPK